MNTWKMGWVALVLSAGLSGAVHAALQGRDLNGSIGSFEAYYDTDLNITWLADANVNGVKTWVNANTWVANLSFTNGVNVYDNWRLPTTLQPDASCSSQSSSVSFGYVSSGLNCTGSEMGHLFYAELSGTAGSFILTSVDPDLAKFTNFNHYYGYWSATVYAPSTNGAWHFLFGDGAQGADAKDSGNLALAVSPGDVGIAAVVPEANTWAMLLAGLGLVGFAARRRTA